jgi:Xaa-Pro aminopeptidase
MKIRITNAPRRRQASCAATFDPPHPLPFSQSAYLNPPLSNIPFAVGKKFLKPAHLKAVEDGIRFRGHFQHPVGMAVHDVGVVHNIPLKAGMVFTIDPMIWIHEERLYIRIEDVALVTETGVENLSGFVPSKLEEVEAMIKEKGLTEFRPAIQLPLKKL